jgi:hypothetical protein
MTTLTATGDLRRILIATLFLLILGSADRLQGQCTVALEPNPLVLISFDVHDDFGHLIGIIPGYGWVDVYSSLPDCVQLYSTAYLVSPLVIESISAPIPFLPLEELWYSRIVIKDGGGPLLGFIGYPHFTGGTVYSFGVHVPSGNTFFGVSAVTLTVFYYTY